MGKLFLLIFVALFIFSVGTCQVMDVRYKISTLITGVGCEGKLELTKNGDLYFTDALHDNLYKFSQSLGVLTRLAGTGVAGLSADGMLGTQTLLNDPRGVAISPTGEVYFADSNNHRIRVLFTNNTIATVVGTGLQSPTDPNLFENEIYFYDFGRKKVKKVNLNTLVVSDVFGDGTFGYLDGNSTTAQLSTCWGMVMDSNTGDIYFGDGLRIRKFEKSTNMVKTISGSVSRNQYLDGPIGQAGMRSPYATSVASNGDIIFSDKADDHVIRKVSLSTNMVSTIAGTGLEGSIDGPDALSSPLSYPNGVLINSEGIIYFSDYGNNRIAMLTPFCTDSNYQLVKGVSCNIKSCFGVPFNDTKVCNGHGQCLNETCQCENNWTGTECQYTTCFGLNSSNPLVCSATGSCVGPNSCACQQGWYGVNCNIFSCFGEKNSSLACSSHGACIALNTCICKMGYSGDDCSLPVCFYALGNSTSVCNGNGICIAPDRCMCNQGYYGQDCSVATCFGETNTSLACSGHGSCIALNTCSCKNGYVGMDCSLPICNGFTSMDVKVCSGKGNCVGPNQCSCQKGFSGRDCEVLLDFCAVFPSDSACSANLTIKDSKIVTVSNLTDLDSKVIEFSSSNSISVALPSSISQYLSGKDVSLSNSSVSLISSVSLSNEKDTQLVSPITTISFVKSGTNNEIRIQNLLNPILINFQINITIPSVDSLNVTCMYFDENQRKWISDSTISTKILNTILIATHLDGNSTLTISLTCATSHLTSFGVIDQNYKKSNKDSTLKQDNNPITQDNSVLIGAIVGSIGGVCVIATIIILIISISIILLRKHKKNSV